jgi:hypothetical protein
MVLEKKSQSSGPGPLHDVGVEPPAFSDVDSRMDPQRHPDIGSHALTLDKPTDT